MKNNKKKLKINEHFECETIMVILMLTCHPYFHRRIYPENEHNFLFNNFVRVKNTQSVHKNFQVLPSLPKEITFAISRNIASIFPPKVCLLQNDHRFVTSDLALAENRTSTSP